MYERYWQLDRSAFDSDFAVESYYASRSHQGALLKLRFCLEHRKGIALLVGDHGVGKTFVTHVLEHDFDPAQLPFVRLTFPQLSPGDMLAYLAMRLGAAPGPGLPRSSQDQLLRGFETRLEALSLEGRRQVIIIDDAHLLQPAHLETLQLLMSVQEHAGSPLQLVLMGRGELLARVERVPGLNQRVSVRMAIDPLPPEEVGGYIEHRLQCAGGEGTMFRPDAYQAFWEISQGVPRKLNQICDLTLLVGYADGMQELTAIEVEAAAEEIQTVSWE